MEKQKKRERERVTVVTRLPRRGPTSPPKRPPAEHHLSVSPPLLPPHSGSLMQGGGTAGSERWRLMQLRWEWWLAELGWGGVGLRGVGG